MTHAESRVTIHMAASLDGFIARSDGRVDWMETPDDFEGGETLDPDYVEEFLATIDCYVAAPPGRLDRVGFFSRRPRANTMDSAR
jgi:hypothetical protein